MLACDFVVANITAEIVPAFSRVGLSPDNNAVGKNLPRRIGYNRALLFLLLGEAVSAERALEWGLVDRVYDPEAFEEGVAASAGALAAVPPVTASLTKRLLSDAPSLPTHLATSYEQLLVGLSTASGDGGCPGGPSESLVWEGRAAPSLAHTA